MASHGVPIPHVLLIIAIAIEILGGLGILWGRFTRPTAAILFLYLLPVTYYMHPFWSAEGPMAQNQMAHFLKNLGLIGALLFVAAHGAGRFSIDSLIRRAEREHPLPGERPTRAA